MPIPLIVAGVAAGAAAAASGALPDLIRTPQEKENAKRLKKLLARGEQLGLTPQQLAELREQYATQLEGAQMESERQQADALANNAASGSGAALRAAGQSQGIRADAGRAAISDIASMNAARKTELEEETEARLAFQTATRKARVAGVGKIVSGGIQGGLIGSGQAGMLGGADPAAPAPGTAAPTAAAPAPTAANVAARSAMAVLAPPPAPQAAPLPPPPTSAMTPAQRELERRRLAALGYDTTSGGY